MPAKYFLKLKIRLSDLCYNKRTRSLVSLLNSRGSKSKVESLESFFRLNKLQTSAFRGILLTFVICYLQNSDYSVESQDITNEGKYKDRATVR